MVDLKNDIKPRMVSMADLRTKLLPLMSGYKGAEDALQDLWRKGAPDPDRAHHPCNRKETGCWFKNRWSLKECHKHACRRERRLLLPTQFATWWKDLSERIGLDFTPAEIMSILTYEHLRDPRKLDGK